MTVLDVLVEGGRRGTARLGLLSLMAGSMLLAGCARQPEPGPSKEEIWRQVYTSRLENLNALDRAFNELGQEYYKLEIEYKNAGRDDLAQISRERAEAFHEQHLAFQQRIAELEEIDGRLRRGESALDIYESRQSQQPEESTYVQPTVRQAEPVQPASESPSGSRFNDPIIITDPQLNNR